MGGIQLAAVLAILLLFGLIVVWMIRSERRDRETKLQISRSLGFTPMDPTPELVRKMTQLYRDIRVNRDHADTAKYEMQNVSSKRLPDGEMLIFDLINTSGGESDYTEKQAVAIISPVLDLPTFVIFPKADIDGALAKVGNQVIAWAMSKMGNLLDFPQSPEFSQRYLVSSPDPARTRQFLNDGRLQGLAKTRLIQTQAGGDIFTLSRVDMFTQAITQETTAEHVNRAKELFDLFAAP